MIRRWRSRNQAHTSPSGREEAQEPQLTRPIPRPQRSLVSVTYGGSQDELTTVVAKSGVLIVGTLKRKAVINAEVSQIERVQPLIDAGRYRTLSEFVREAMDEKLQRLEQERIGEAVERYCAAGHASEDIELIDGQAFDTKGSSPSVPSRVRTAAR